MTMDTPRRITSDDPALGQVLDLIRAEFAYMDGIVNPPSSMHLMSLDTLRRQSEHAEVWAIGAPVHACVILTPYDYGLYLGKLAVNQRLRGTGIARRLIDLAVERARMLGLPLVELATRIELVDNQRLFERLGFAEVRRDTHDGFTRPTSIVYHKPVTPNKKGHNIAVAARCT